VPRFLSAANRPLLLLALGLALSACSTSSVLTSEVRVKTHDPQVWNDFMPGSRPLCHATMMLTLRNTTQKDIVLLGGEGLLANPRTGAPLRRFPLVMLYQNVETPEVRLAPGMEIELMVRTPIGIPAFDHKQHERVRFSADFRTSLERPLRVQSRPVTPFVTQ
jgi:hypothetical protein